MGHTKLRYMLGQFDRLPTKNCRDNPYHKALRKQQFSRQSLWVELISRKPWFYPPPWGQPDRTAQRRFRQYRSTTTLLATNRIEELIWVISFRKLRSIEKKTRF